MALYLQMDGVDDYVLTPAISEMKVEFDLKVNKPSAAAILTASAGNFTLTINADGTVTYRSDKISSVLVNGEQVANNTAFIPWGQRITLTLVHISQNFWGNYIFTKYNTGGNYLAGNIYNVRYFNASGNLITSYDMSTGTVQDKTGTKHATLTGGTWLDDGAGGTPTGEDGSVSVDTKQVMYQDGANPFDIRNILYQDSSTSSDTKQVLYEISSTSFDMLQEIFNDGQVGQTPFDMRFLLYSDGSILHDSRQGIYESGLSTFDLQQALYESGEGKADIHLVLFADSSTHHDLIQSLWEDAQVQFDTRQTLFDTDKQVIGVIPLKGNRELYVYLAGRQQLTFPLKGKQDLFINLRGDVNVTIDNGLFKMYAGDSKYLPITVEGVTDFSGAMAKWALMPSVYSTEHTLLKTIGNGISITDGKLQVKLDSVDTKNLLGKFYFETELTDALGNVSTVAVGEIEIKKSGV